MDILKNIFAVKMELFASPLNHYYDQYYSLFDIDQMFGGLGNSLNLKEFPEGGYEANPPFVEHIMEKSALNIM